MSEIELVNLILSLTCAAIHGSEVTVIPDDASLEWEKVYEYAEKNLLVPLLYDRISELQGIPANILDKWKAAARYSMLVQLEKYKELKRLLSKASENNITFIFLKGCVLAGLYPRYAARSCSDTDILVFPKDINRAVRFFEEEGYLKDVNKSNEFVFAYRNPTVNTTVELHLCLWEKDGGKRAGLLDCFDLAGQETLIKVKTCDMEVVTLGFEEHLIFQIHHIIKHFTLQGITMRYLIDITLYVNQYEQYMDYSRLWDRLKQLQYDRFSEALFRICVHYLKLTPGIIKDRKSLKKELEMRFLLDLMKAGSIYEVQNESWQLSNIIEPYYSGNKRLSKSVFLRKINYLLMMFRHFSKNYKKSRRLLLPFAWIQKCFRFIIRSNKNKMDWKDAFRAKLSIVDKRLLLMRDLGLEVGQKDEV